MVSYNKATTNWIIVSHPPPTCLSSHRQLFLYNIIALIFYKNIDDVIILLFLWSVPCALELQAEFVISMTHSVLAHVSHCSSRSA